MRRLALFSLIPALSGCDPAPGSAAVASAEASSTAPASASAAPLAREARARVIVEQLAKGDHERARDEMGEDLRKVLDAGKLKDAWTTSAAGKGAFRGIDAVASHRRKGREQVVVRVALENGTMDVLVGYEGGDKPSSFFLRPAKPLYAPPDYVDMRKVSERELDIGKGDLAIPGTLTLPRGAPGPVAAVVFLHGSGPQDRDSTMGTARPFRDIALGLASRGIASIRWDKRTTDPIFIHATGLKPEDLTVEQEYLIDAAAAIELAKSTQEIDPRRIFLLGHSEGGWLTPWMLEKHPELAGAVLLAANARHFNAIVPSQIEYIAKLDDGAIGPLEKIQLEAIRDQCERTRKKDLAPDTPASDLPLGIPAPYWIAIRDYDAVATAKKLAVPLFALQGERDYQVTPADDLALWKPVIQKNEASRSKIYPTLNHAFIAGEGKIAPREYLELKGSVAREVVEDIASWIDERK